MEKRPLLPERAAELINAGYGVWVTALLIISEVAGGGIVSLPNALYREGYFGIMVMVFAAILCTYTGMQLGWCWTIMQERWPVYNLQTRQPYSEIGFRAAGKLGKVAVSICVYITLFGIATVFLLLASSNISDLLKRLFNTQVSSCYWLLVVALILLPITYLESPKNFWPVTFGAAGCTTLAVIIIIVGVFKYYSQNTVPVTHTQPTFVDFVLGYGTILFAFGGHAVYPTIQHDMKSPSLFYSAVVKASVVITLYYLLASVPAYFVYGDVLGRDNNILRLLPVGWIQDLALILITLHVLFSFVIIINPVNQDLEHWFRLENRVGAERLTWKRVLLRTALLALVLFVAESVPSFGIILDLIGGTTVACMTFVFPGAFYLLLRRRRQNSVNGFDEPIRWYEWLLNFVVITLGLVGGVASFYAAVETVMTGGNDLFKLPCYLTNR